MGPVVQTCKLSCWELSQKDHKFTTGMGNLVRHCLKIESGVEVGSGCGKPEVTTRWQNIGEPY